MQPTNPILSKPADPILEQVRQEAERQRKEDEMACEALAEPLPGPLKDAFAMQQDIEVGRWKVRPFYDIDFEFLSLLGHPLYHMMKAAMSGKDYNEAVNQIPRGPEAWELAWILTRDTDEVELAVKKGGGQAVKDAAKKEFGKLQFPAIVGLVKAAFSQLSIYWGTVISYGEPEKKREDGEVMGEQSPNPFKSLGQPSTDSAGCSTSGRC